MNDDHDGVFIAWIVIIGGLLLAIWLASAIPQSSTDTPTGGESAAENF